MNNNEFIRFPMGKIKVGKSSCADTRTCDFTKVTKEQLEHNSRLHIGDVYAAMNFFNFAIMQAARHHDHTKISGLDQFHEDFVGGFKTTIWWDNHRKEERHHLSEADGIRDDVDLIDVLEFIADCVMAGIARSGEVRPLTISDETLRKAFENTWKMLANKVEVKDEKETDG